MKFTGRIVRSSGRGKKLGYPTLNIDLADVPPELEEGIYACTANEQQAVMHYGPRPVFKERLACEVHLLDTDLPSTPSTLTIEVQAKLRDVQDFPNAEELKKHIAKDIEEARAILQSCHPSTGSG